MKTGYFIRDTLVSYDVLNSLPIDRQEKIKELTVKYNSLGYIDCRFNLGNDQIRRMTDRQKGHITNTALTVFEIESEIKQLLKTDAQLQQEQNKQAETSRNNEIQRIKYRLRDIEMYLMRKLNSPRENTTKKEYRELKEKLNSLL